MPGLRTTEFVVDGVRYKTAALDAYRNRGLYLRLVKAMSPALSKLDLKALRGDNKEQAFFGLVSLIIADFPEQLFNDLCDAFGAVTTEERQGQSISLGEPGVFGLHFACRYQQMIKWLVECCKANNYLDFLPGISSEPNAPTEATAK